MTFAGPDSVIAKFGRFALFLGRLVGGTPFVLRRPRLWIEQIHMSGALSLVIIMLSGLFVGMVLGLQGYDLLRRFGSTESLGTAAALGLLRELGPVITALLFAGRAGTAITSEIGLMLATDQLAAMEMMAVDPVKRICVPRFLGGVAAMPLLAAIFARVLEDAGFRVARRDPVELDRAGYYAAIQAGDFQLIPDFSGDLMKYLYAQPGAPTAPTTVVPQEPATTQAPITVPAATLPPTTVAGDTTPTTQTPITVAPTTTLPVPVLNGRTATEQIKAIRAAIAKTVAVDDGLVAENKTVIACTQATMTANQNTQLFTLTNLASIAPKIRIGGSAEFLAASPIPPRGGDGKHVRDAGGAQVVGLLR